MAGPRNCSRREHIADACLHGVGLTGAFAGGGWLLLNNAQNGGGELGALGAYALGLVGMLAASAAYNLAPPGPRKALLRRLDHAMIFVMIAGTYTPFAAHRLDGLPGHALGTAVWLGALLGASVKLLHPQRIERLGTALYLLLGWTILVVLDRLAEAVAPVTLTLLLLGGAAYTVGAVVHHLDRLPYNRVVWHALVLAGAECHFAAIAVEFAP